MPVTRSFRVAIEPPTRQVSRPLQFTSWRPAPLLPPSRPPLRRGCAPARFPKSTAISRPHGPRGEGSPADNLAPMEAAGGFDRLGPVAVLVDGPSAVGPARP